MPKYITSFCNSYLLLSNRVFKHKYKLNFVNIITDKKTFTLKDVNLVRACGRKAIKLPTEIRRFLKKNKIKEVVIETFV